MITGCEQYHAVPKSWAEKSSGWSLLKRCLYVRLAMASAFANQGFKTSDVNRDWTTIDLKPMIYKQTSMFK